MQDELLNETLFSNLAHADDMIADWVANYNTAQPHSAFDYVIQAGFGVHLTTAMPVPLSPDESFVY